MAKKQENKPAAKKAAGFSEESANAELLKQGIGGPDGGKLSKGDKFYVTEDYMAFHGKNLDSAKVYAKQNNLKMIRVIFGMALLSLFAFSASAQYYINWPFAAADSQDLTDSDSVTLQINNAFTIVQSDTGDISQAITELNVDANDELPVGSILIILIEQGSTGRNVTMGDEFDTVHAPNLTGVANDKDLLVMYWTGTVWVAVTAAWQKILDAA